MTSQKVDMTSQKVGNLRKPVSSIAFSFDVLAGGGGKSMQVVTKVFNGYLKSLSQLGQKQVEN